MGIKVCHPHTRDRSRLLGPCFKTGRKKPYCPRPRTTSIPRIAAKKGSVQNSTQPSQRISSSASRTHSYIQTRVSHQPEGTPQRTTQTQGYYPSTEYTRTRKHEKHCGRPAPNYSYPYGADSSIHLNPQQSHTNIQVSFAYFSAISGTFNSLSKVLFIFPSRYLFAIGLKSIFSFRWQLPPILRTTSKVRDSKTAHRQRDYLHLNGILTLSDAFFQRDLGGAPRW